MKSTIDKVKYFAKRLRHYKKVNPFIADEFEHDARHNYCHLVVFKDGKPHLFQVRGFKVDKFYAKISVSAVNWTLAAGTCIIDLTEKSIKEYNIQILEDSPAIRTLYGF